MPRITTASDFQFTVQEVATAIQSEYGKEVKLPFGSTGNFAHQIRKGAPFQMFMAADEHCLLVRNKDQPF